MTAVAIVVADLTPFLPNLDPARGQAMIDDAMATARWHAPCIASSDFEHTDAAKAIIRRALLRWGSAGDGGVQTKQATAGPFGQMLVVDAGKAGRAFWDSEIADLKKLCDKADKSFFVIDTAPSLNGYHLPWCSLSMGAAYCSCGVVIAGYPIYEQE